MDLIKIKLVREDYDSSQDIRIRIGERDILYPKCSIKSLISGNPLSWFHHNVFKLITYVYWDKDSGSESPKLYLEDSKLYNINKLKVLTNSVYFKQEKYAFFFYGEAQRILGIPQTESDMSGLMSKEKS